MSLLPVDQAIAQILAHVPPVSAETVPIREAAGRVLAGPVLAGHDQPPFNASAMDGYAVRARDVAPGRPLALIGTSQAGQGFAGSVRENQCVRIFTGAPVPEGADAVIMQEEATPTSEGVVFSAAPKVGRSIRVRGFDFSRGSTLLAPGTLLTPNAVALAAAANQAVLTVARRPRLALVATGDELVLPGAALGADQVIASNSFGLAPLLAPFCETVADLGIIPDIKQRLAEALTEALEGPTDIVVTIGGASVGDHDLVQDVLRDIGVDIRFWRIAMRPGKPLMVGTKAGRLVFGLPGNPVSAMVTATVLLRPALRRWLGLVESAPLRLPLGASTPPNTARRHFMRARIVTRAEGATVAIPIAETDSGHLSSLAAADALIVQPEDDPGREAGELVEIIPFSPF